MINGLKEKFFPLPENDSLRVPILTILPDYCSLRDFAEELNVSLSIAKKARDLRYQCGVLATPDSKKGKPFPESTVKKFWNIIIPTLTVALCQIKKSFKNKKS